MEREIVAGVPCGLSNAISTRRYNWFTFLPLSVLFQFRRASNCYFLFMVVLVLIPGIAPVSSYSTIFPLLFVIGVSEVREAVEEWGASQRDKAINSAPVDLLTGRVLCANLRPGDIVLLKNNERIPADLLVLQTSHSDRASMFVETASLDGETNLKLRRALAETADCPLSQLGDGQFFVACESPNVDMYAFKGELAVCGPNGGKYEATLSNVVWRGCTVRNTEWIIGLVVYTGHETKMLLNARSGLSPAKFTSMDGQMNRNVLCIVALQVVLCCVCASFGVAQFSDHPWYLGTGANWASLFFTFFVLLGNLIPVSLWVSVELLKVAQAVMIEKYPSGTIRDTTTTHKTTTHHTHNTTTHYTHKPTTPIKCNSKNLNEELGQITHVFTDKTGTLTVNKMKFVGCNVFGRNYFMQPDDTAVDPVLPFEGVLPPSSLFMKILADSVKTSEADSVETLTERELFTAIALCHTCERVVEPISGKTVNQSASPDEAALVSAAADAGVVFMGRPTVDKIQLQICGLPVQFTLLRSIAFTSERRMMTVVVCNEQTNEVIICSKGADSSIIPKCVEGEIVLQTILAVSKFSRFGFRTLCIAVRRISNEQWIDLADKPDEIIESNLLLVGCTAVEDRLQDGVPETLRALKSAGIKVCMITGDKRETAINIAMSCGLVGDKANVHVMLGAAVSGDVRGAGAFVPLSCLEDIANNEWTHSAPLSRQFWEAEIDSLGLRGNEPCVEEVDEPTLVAISRSVSIHEQGFVSAFTSSFFSLVIDGKCLHSILESPSATRQLVEVLSFEKCEAVVFCRVSPKQKGDIVRLVKSRLISDFSAHRSTLAIGDGANDINMINIANVGVGIAGNEGAQAANSADYSIREFRDLYTLLFVHGRWNYRRTSKFILVFIYKNFAFTLCQFWFAIMSGFSGQTVSESSYLLLFNSVFGIVPLFVLGTLNRDVDPNTEGPLHKTFHPEFVTEEYWREIIVPKLFQLEPKFNSKNVLMWCFMGFVQSVIVFFGVWVFWLAPMAAVDPHGSPPCMWMGSILVYTVEIVILSAVTLWVCDSWNKILLWTTFVFNIVAYFGFVFIYDMLHISGANMFVWYLATSALLNSQFWLILVLLCAIALAPMILFPRITTTLNPRKWMSLSSVIQQMKKHISVSINKLSRNTV